MRTAFLVLFITFAQVFAAESVATIVPKTPEQKEGCYQIGTAEELYGFAQLVNSMDSTDNSEVCGQLTANIIVNDSVVVNDTLNTDSTKSFIPWTPIQAFKGVFDGQNYTISGLYCDEGKKDSIGFFGSVGKSASDVVTIKNLRLRDVFFYGSGVGGIVSRARSSLKIINSHVSGALASSGNVGGLVGILFEYMFVNDRKDVLLIDSSSNSARLYGNFGGGLICSVDNVEDIRVENSYNTGSISGVFLSGGLVGAVDRGNLTVINSYNLGNLFGYENVGGVIGAFGETWEENQRLTVLNSYVQGFIHGTKVVDAVIASALPKTKVLVDNVYYSEGQENRYGGTPVKNARFKDGSVAAALHSYNGYGVDGSVWGQNVKVDSVPVFRTMETALQVHKLNLVTYTGDTTKYNAQYVEGLKSYLPKPSREGFVFAGWFADKNYSGDAVLTVGEKDTEDKTLYAKWIEIKAPVKNGKCYDIGSVEELYQFAVYVNDTNRTDWQDALCARLTADITVNKNVLVGDSVLNGDYTGLLDWIPIHAFRGTFDGQGHTISGLYFSDERIDSVGFIGSLVAPGSFWDEDTSFIRNLHIADSYFRGKEFVGGIVGANVRTYLYMNNCSHKGIIRAESYAGGLLGNMAYKGAVAIDSSFNEGFVYSKGCAGGLSCGLWNDGYIRNSYNSAKIDGGYSVGGLTGASGSATIFNSYNVGTVKGENRVGGLVGSADASEIIQSCNMANVSGIVSVGGVTGEGSSSIINSCNTGDIDVEWEGGGLIGNIEGGSIRLMNSFSAGHITDTSYTFGGLIGSHTSYTEIEIKNCYFLNSSKDARVLGTQASLSQYADGTVYASLSAFEEGDVRGNVWYQEKGKNPYPVLRYLYVEFPNSSNPGDLTPVVVAMPQVAYSTAVYGKTLHITGLAQGQKITLYNVKGKRIADYRMNSSEMSIPLPQSGIYLVRIGTVTKRIMSK